MRIFKINFYKTLKGNAWESLSWPIGLGLPKARTAASPASPATIVRGLRRRHLVFASELAHYSIEWILNQIGLGTDACVRIPCDRFGRIDVSALEQRLNAAAADQVAIAAVILSGGDTIDHVIDPIEEVCGLLARVKEKYCLPYDPFVYVDLVNGWIWRLFEDYNFEVNPLKIGTDDLEFVRSYNKTPSL